MYFRMSYLNVSAAFLITGQRQPHSKGAPFSRLAFDLDSAPMPVHDPFHQRQTEPNSFDLFLTRRLGPVESFENMR